LAPVNKSLPGLVEGCRQSLGRRLIRPLLDGEGTLPVLLLEPAIEEELLGYFGSERGPRQLAGGTTGATPLLKRIVDSLKGLIGPQATSALPVLLCPSPARYYLRRWLEPLVPQITVVSPSEIPPETKLRAVGTIR
jgi:flagellar biosynthesis protein FlhA